MSIALPAWAGTPIRHPRGSGPAVPGAEDENDFWSAADHRRGRLGRVVRRAMLAVVITLCTALTTGAVVADQATASALIATTEVNVRTGPGLDHRVIDTLSRGQRVDKISSSGSWTKIKFGSTTGWAASRYLTARSSVPAPPLPITGTKITTTAVNLRVSPGTASKVDRVLPKGTVVSVTGRVTKGFAEVVFGGASRWVSAQYLVTTRPRAIGYRTATADLIIRSSSADTYKDLGEIKKGSKVAITGTTQNGRAQIILRGAVRWVTARYLSNGKVTQPPAPSLPRVVGWRYATASLLLRSTSGSDYKVLGEVAVGTKLGITGTYRSGRAQIVYGGAVRWVTSTYLARNAPGGSSGGSGGGSGVERGLQPNAIKVHRAAMVAFPEITTYYGVRPDAIPDHPSGLALDLMIPGNYRSAAGRALGRRIADWAQRNQASLGIEYIIWDQHIWNVKRVGEGWRYMADRGSDSANHKNHVHITVFR